MVPEREYGYLTPESGPIVTSDHDFEIVSRNDFISREKSMTIGWVSLNGSRDDPDCYEETDMGIAVLSDGTVFRGRAKPMQNRGGLYSLYVKITAPTTRGVVYCFVDLPDDFQIASRMSLNVDKSEGTHFSTRSWRETDDFAGIHFLGPADPSALRNVSVRFKVLPL